MDQCYGLLGVRRGGRLLGWVVVESSVGIFGGTFDPPHVGHVAAAERCRSALGLDRVLLVVANDPWQKSPDRPVSPAAVRMAMVAAAVAGHPGLEASELEIARGGPSYTIETVEELERTEGVRSPWVIVGSDLSTTLSTWERADELAGLVRIAVLSRPGSPLILPDGWRSVAVATDELDVSSSLVRARVASGLDIVDLVAPEVVRHIRANHLYIEGTDASS
jgi:nicotinate-nucleotide adenylyltransferase